MTCVGRALVCATLQEANWNRSSSCWDMSRFKRPSDTLAASSGFGRRSMIASESNQIAESRGSGRVADQPTRIRGLTFSPSGRVTRAAIAISGSVRITRSYPSGNSPHDLPLYLTTRIGDRDLALTTAELCQCVSACFAIFSGKLA
jgi:hypothetical protein